MTRDRLAASEVTCRSRIASAIAEFQAALFLSHAAAAEANMADSTIPDPDIICSHYPLSDLVNVYSYITYNTWALRHLITRVNIECAPGTVNTSRLRAIFADEASVDRHCARDIQRSAQLNDDSDLSAINPAALAIADCTIVVRAIATLLDNLPYNHDPTSAIGTSIAACNFTISNDSLALDGLNAVLIATDTVAKLPKATLSSLDMRACYSSIVDKVIPLRHFSLRIKMRGITMDWSSAISDIIMELHANGMLPIRIAEFSNLLALLDDFAGLAIDFANQFHKAPMPTNHFVASLEPAPKQPLAAAALPPSASHDETTLLRQRISDLEDTIRNQPLPRNTHAPPPPSRDIDSRLAHLESFVRVAAFNAPRHEATPPRSTAPPRKYSDQRDTRGHGPPTQRTTDPKPRYTAKDWNQPKLPCTDAPNCPLKHRPWWIACSCGAPAAGATVCLICPDNPVSIDKCNSCHITFNPSNSRAINHKLDSAKLGLIAQYARDGNMGELMPWGPRPTHRVQALALSPFAHFTPQDHLDMFDDRNPPPNYARLNAFRSPRGPTTPSYAPTTQPAQQLMLVPAVLLLNGSNTILATGQLSLLGFTGDLMCQHPTLIDPSNNIHPVRHDSDGFPTLDVQLIAHPDGAFLGIGFPPNTGIHTTALLDTCANKSAVTRDIAHILTDTSPGEQIILGGLFSHTTDGSGTLPIRCFDASAPIAPLQAAHVVEHPPPVPIPTTEPPPPTPCNHLPEAPTPQSTNVDDPAPQQSSPPHDDTHASPEIPPPSTSHPITSANTWIVTASPLFMPDSFDNMCIIAAYRRSDSFPFMHYAPDNTASAVFHAIDSLFAHLRASPDACPLPLSIMVCPTILDHTSAAATSHALSRGYRFEILPTPTTPIGSCPTFLRPLLDQTSSHSDSTAMIYFNAAYEALYNNAYTSEPYGNLAFASRDLFSLACNIYKCGLTTSSHGRISRFQSLYHICPDISNYLHTSVPTGPSRAITRIYLDRLVHDSLMPTLVPLHHSPIAPIPAFTPGDSWTCTVSHSIVPDDLGNHYDVYFTDRATTYPVITSVPDRSTTSLKRSIEHLFSSISGTEHCHISISTILIDPSWFPRDGNPIPDISDTTISAHMLTNSYRLLVRTTNIPPNCSLPPEICDFASAACSCEDLYALYLFYCAYRLRSAPADCHPSQRTLPACSSAKYQYLREACHRFRQNTIQTPYGPQPRSDALAGAPQDSTPPADMQRPSNLLLELGPILDHFPHLRHLNKDPSL